MLHSTFAVRNHHIISIHHKTSASMSCVHEVVAACLQVIWHHPGPLSAYAVYTPIICDISTDKMIRAHLPELPTAHMPSVHPQASVAVIKLGYKRDLVNLWPICDRIHQCDHAFSDTLLTLGGIHSNKLHSNPWQGIQF